MVMDYRDLQLLAALQLIFIIIHIISFILYTQLTYLETSDKRISRVFWWTTTDRIMTYYLT